MSIEAKRQNVHWMCAIKENTLKISLFRAYMFVVGYSVLNLENKLFQLLKSFVVVVEKINSSKNWPSGLQDLYLKLSKPIVKYTGTRRVMSNLLHLFSNKENNIYKI